MSPISVFVYKDILNYLLRQQELVTASVSQKVAVKTSLRGSVISSVTTKHRGINQSENMKDIIKEFKALPLREQT